MKQEVHSREHKQKVLKSNKVFFFEKLKLKTLYLKLLKQNQFSLNKPLLERKFSHEWLQAVM